MAKLKLRVEELTIDSFDTSPPARDEGTVFGEQQCTCQTACSCPPCPSCVDTCWETCQGDTCAETCQGASCDWCGSAVFTCVCIE